MQFRFQDVECKLGYTDDEPAFFAESTLQILIQVLHPFFRAMGYLGFGKLK